jgi:hypothetical protein
LLPATDARWLGFGVRGHFHEGQSLLYPRSHLRRGKLCHSQAVPHVLFHGEMREECVMLEHRIQAPLVRRQWVEPLAAHPDLPGRSALEARDDTQ